MPNKDNWGNQDIPGFNQEYVFSEEFIKFLRYKEQGEITKQIWENFSELERDNLIKKQLGNRDYDSWYEKNLIKNKSNEFRKKLTNSQLERYQDPGRKAKHQEGVNKYWKDEENRKKESQNRSERARGKKFPSEFGQKISKTKNQEIKVPWGLFDSRKSATQWAIKHGIPDPARKIGKGLKTNPLEFYYTKK